MLSMESDTESERPSPGGAHPSLRGAGGRADRGPAVCQQGQWLGPFSGGGRWAEGRQAGEGTLVRAEGTRGQGLPGRAFPGQVLPPLGPRRLISASCHSGAQHQKVLRGQNREPVRGWAALAATSAGSHLPLDQASQSRSGQQELDSEDTGAQGP